MAALLALGRDPCLVAVGRLVVVAVTGELELRDG